MGNRRRFGMWHVSIIMTVHSKVQVCLACLDKDNGMEIKKGSNAGVLFCKLKVKKLFSMVLKISSLSQHVFVPSL